MLKRVFVFFAVLFSIVLTSIPVFAQVKSETLKAQGALKMLGYNIGVVDGDWGPKSNRALIAFLDSMNVKFDGQLDANELQLLQTELNTRKITPLTSYQLAKESGLRPQSLPYVAKPGQQSYRDIFRAFIDINGDGVEELFIATTMYHLGQSPSTATLSYFAFYRKRSNGKYVLDESLINNPSKTCIHPRKAVVGDFNSDNQLDVFVACHGWDDRPRPGERNKVLLSQPDGRYVISDASKDVGFFHGAAAADFNGDGATDIVVANNNSNTPIQVWLNDGTGKFRKTSKYIPSILKRSARYFTVELPDVNGDGLFDLFVGGHEWDKGKTYVFINPGNGNFAQAKRIQIPTVDGQGIVLDVVATGNNDNRSIWVLRTSGGGDTFYDGITVQQVSIPDARSVIRFQKGGINWVPSIIQWTEGSRTYVGGDIVGSGLLKILVQ